jgi:hypothetical protein
MFRLAAWRRLMLSGGLALTGATAQEPAARASIGGPPRAIVLDGLLNEAAWEAARPIGELRMVEPTAGAPASGLTRVLVLADARHIVIGIDARDADGENVVAFSRDRDADLASEDHVKLLLDTFLDGRTGYVFAVNPIGARYDALVTGSGEGERKEWDAAWESATMRTAGGWSAEIRIPIQSLAFREGLREWGFNIERRIQRRLEVVRWSSPTRAARVIHPARAGRLTGLPAFVFGRGLSMRPAIVAGRTRVVPAGAASRGEVSGDVTQRLGAHSALSVTVNTDFAETEVDARRTNLTRFPLFFPEKRTFFLEGSDNFEFAPAEGRQVDLVPYHSRRIGLQAGGEVPVQTGVRANGRVGQTSFTALGVQTAAVDGIAPRSAMGAARVRQNIFGESSIGAIGTWGDPAGRAGAWMTGADLAFRTSRLGGSRNLTVGAWGLATGRDGLVGDRSAVGLSVAYPTDPWTASVTYKRIGSGFDPSLGFVPRRGVEIGALGLDYRWHNALPRVRDLIFQLQGRAVLDTARTVESYAIFTAPFYVALESGDRVEVNVVPVGERLARPFEVASGVQIAPGRHDWIRYRAEATFASKRRVSGRATLWFGDFYDGTLREWAATAVYKPAATTTIELSGVHNAGMVSGGRFTQQVIAMRLRYNISADLTFNTYVQYDEEARLLTGNTRVRWQFHPLGEAFLVYNDNRRREAGSWEPSSDQILLKVQYAVRY